MNKSVTCHDLSGVSLSRKKVFAAAGLLNKISPDILQLNHTSLLHYALPLLSSSIKPVVVLHSDDARFYRIATLFSRRIFRWIAPTSGLAKSCERYLPSGMRCRIRIIPHGVSKDIFCKDNQNVNLNDRKIIFIGYLGETKGADLLPDIMQLVLNSCPDTKMILIGEGPLRLHLEQRFRKEGLLHKCELSGSVSQDAVARRLRESCICLLPTRLEGFGLTIVEAMLSRVVPVVSRLRGITDDIIDDGKTGVLVTPGDMKGYAESIIHLLKNPEKLRSMSRAARVAAEEKYSMARMLDAYESLFGEEDDRELTPCRGTLGWLRETIGEVTKRDIDGRLPLKHLCRLAAHMMRRPFHHVSLRNN